MKLILFLSIAFSTTVFATDGYLPSKVEITYIKGRGAVIQNTACFPVVVSVNGKDFSIPSSTELPIGSEMWGAWHWRVGTLGLMSEKTVQSPLKYKFAPEIGPGEAPAHKNDFLHGYDFFAVDGTLCMPWKMVK